MEKKAFTVELTQADRDAIEALRIKWGCRSGGEVIRLCIEAAARKEKLYEVPIEA